jgi:hypothetical protein
VAYSTQYYKKFWDLAISQNFSGTKGKFLNVTMYVAIVYV